MSDETPALGLSAQELWQWSQAVTAVSAIAARLRTSLARSREQSGRLAVDDAEHAARLAESWEWPPVRSMTAAEREEWRSRIPAALAAPMPEGAVVEACAARMPYPAVPIMPGSAPAPGMGWGVEAHARDADGRVESAWLVCRDASDAVALAAGLRRDGSAAQVRRLRDLAAGLPPTTASHDGLGLGLSEWDWIGALREELPTQLADRLIPSDPADPCLAAWRQLARLARDEVDRVGADPRQLAALIRMIPRWEDDVRNPAALAHWALTQARAQPGYVEVVVPAVDPAEHDEHPGSVVEDGSRRASERTFEGATVASSWPISMMPSRPISPAQAAVWAASLDGSDAEHRLAAKVEFGRWGAAVDRALAQRFPGLVTSASAAADQVAARTTRTTASTAVPTASAAPSAPAAAAAHVGGGDDDPLTIAELAEQVERMNPARPVDRRAAHVMLGRVPVQIDRLLAAKFGDDPVFAAKVAALYPHGLPDEPETKTTAHPAAATATQTADGATSSSSTPVEPSTQPPPAAQDERGPRPRPDHQQLPTTSRTAHHRTPPPGPQPRRAR